MYRLVVEKSQLVGAVSGRVQRREVVLSYFTLKGSYRVTFLWLSIVTIRNPDLLYAAGEGEDESVLVHI